MSDQEEYYYSDSLDEETTLVNEADELYEEELYNYFPDPEDVTSDTQPELTWEEDGDASSNATDDSQQLNLEEDVSPTPQSNPTDIWTQEEFDRGYLVSRTPAGDASAASSAAFKDAFIDYATHFLDWRRYHLASREATEPLSAFVSHLHDWATHYEHVRGKWMVFARPSIADALWLDIHRANLAGSLGGRCEVRPRNRKADTHLISVYCDDFNDTRACARVLRALAAVCRTHGARVAAFKPEMLTTLGVYRERAGAPDAEVRYTYAELGMGGGACAPEALRRALKAAGGGSVPKNAPSRRSASRSTRRRRSRQARSGRYMRAEGTGEFENAYATGERSFPSRPNGVWSADEIRANFLVHHAPGGAPHADYSDAFALRANKMLSTLRGRAHVADALEKRARMRSLYDLAGSFGLTCGKWKVFAPPSVADELWDAIRGALDAGDLGPVAKISTFNRRSGTFLVCVYCNDFRDVGDCRRVLYALSGICGRFGVPIVSNFKCDFLSHLGVYAVKGEGSHERIDVRWSLAEMGMRGHWANENLKEVLDELKDQLR